MKRLILVILVIFYSALSIQLHACIHFCKGRFISIKLFESNANKKCCQGLNIKKDCCKQYQLILKKQSHESDTKVKISVLFEPIPVISNHKFNFNYHFLNHEIVKSKFELPPSPKIFKSKIYILNNVFII